jgi:tricorn protease
MRARILLVCLAVVSFVASGRQRSGYYRFPAIHGNTIVFTSEGDLWTVGVGGGLAQRLTTHPGMESMPAISPDGKLIAFSAQYEGPTEVYTMPIDGGLPTRRTYEGESALVVGWTPDGKILYATRHHSTLPNAQIVELDITTGARGLVPLSQASDGCFDPPGRTFFFTRFAFQGSHTKRYQGGTAQNIWKYAQGAKEALPLTSDYRGTSKTPMYWNARIYFASDRDGTMNIWSMNLDGGDVRQHTFNKGWDAKYPSLDGGRIVYQAGADIHLFDIAQGADRIVPITLASDFDQTREKWVKKPMDYLTSVSISPNGDRVVLTARGQVFVAPAQQGRFVTAAATEGVRFRSARFMPDGKSLFMLSDATGELEFWKYPASGVGKEEQLTDDGKVYRYQGVASPDGKWIAFDDKNYKLWLFNVAEKKDLQIASSDMFGFSDLAWSPDSKWLAYAVSAENLNSQIRLYSLDEKTTTPVTSDRVESYSPAWSPDSSWLYFLSDRQFQSAVGSPWGPRQPEPYFDKTTKVYAMALTKDLRFPFAPDDELAVDTAKGKKADQAKKEKPKTKPAEMKVDLDGIQSRLYEVPIESGNYSNLSIAGKTLYWTDTEGAPRPKRKLVALEIKNKDIASATLVSDIKGYELSLDGKKMLIYKGDDLYVVDASAKAPSELEKKKVDLSNWRISLDPRDEWRQMFVEAWRLERDYFYDPHLHGVDAKGLLARHLPLVERVNDREELNDLISSLVGELAALHTFVFGGDIRQGEDHIAQASLGAILVRDERAGGYRLDHIFRSDPDYPGSLSPLARPGVNVSEGDIIEMVNGKATLSAGSVGELLENQAGQQVLLKVKSPSTGKESDVIVKPITMQEESNLRYSEWEYTRRLRVDELSKSEIGYVHLRAMGSGNIAEWVREYYPVFTRQGLIIDVRHNRGGNIDSWILEKLLRKAWFYWKGRVGKPYWNMQYAFRGPIVVLCDESTASDGEAFTEGFRRLALGKVIGTRTWGGEIWLSASNFLVDKGIATAAETGVYGPGGNWLIEGHGVDPDIVVDNTPHETYGGKDAQLDAAIEYLQEQIRLHPVEVPPPPKYPNKAFDYK